MEIHKLISDIMAGKVRVLSFDSVALGPGKDIIIGILAALNFARLAFAFEGSALSLPKILGLICSKKSVENVLSICSEWPGGVRDLEVEDVYRTPLFEVSTKLVSKDYDSPSPDHITSLLENLCTLNSSAAIIITRYPDVVACLRLRTPTQDVFVLFNPGAASDRTQVASLTLTTSLPRTVQLLCDVFPLDKIHSSGRQLGWQAKLLEKCSGHVFVPRATSSDSSIEEESLIVSSLTLLVLRAELRELTEENGDLKRDQQRLEKCVVGLEAQLTEEKAKAKRSQTSKPPVVKSTYNPSLNITRSPQFSRSSDSSGEDDDPFISEDEMDPSMAFAQQLQATFDSENNLLLKQRYDLMQTAQRQYHCGVCLDDFPEDDAVRIEACGHEICRDCARGHVVTKIEEHRFPVLCPVCMADHGNKKPGTVSGMLVQLLGVSEKQWETWVEMEMAQFSIPFNCRKCQLSGFVDKQDLEGQDEISCPFPACDHVWCRKCQQSIEPGGSKHSCDGSAELDHLMKQQGWRYCPNCKTPIQKINGCNHLSCVAPGCNTHFCYRCGKTINQTAIPGEIIQGKTEHFRTCTLF